MVYNFCRVEERPPMPKWFVSKVASVLKKKQHQGTTITMATAAVPIAIWFPDVAGFSSPSLVTAVTALVSGSSVRLPFCSAWLLTPLVLRGSVRLSFCSGPSSRDLLSSSLLLLQTVLQLFLRLPLARPTRQHEQPQECST